MKTLSRVAAQKIERVRALGYAEARRRKIAGCHPKAVLDALVETTVVACDLFHLSAHSEASSGDDFYLSNIEVEFKGVKRSSLAPFDADIGRILSLAEPVNAAEGVKFSFPSGHECIAELLSDFWQDAANEFEPMWGGDAASSVDPAAVSNDIAEEFFESLRHALDAVVQVDARDTFTIRVVQTGNLQQVVDQHQVDYALGYWLPATGLYSLPSEVARDEFETLLKTTVKTPRVRQQSHTNVWTRLAGLVCQPTARSLQFSFVGEYEFVNELEKKVWPHGEYAHIFMVPLSSHDFSPFAPRTVAHVYKGFEVNSELDLEQLLLWRYRATLLFAERLRREYCHVVARHLAKHLLAKTAENGRLNDELRQLAAIFCMPLITADPASRPSESLLADLNRALNARVAVGIVERSLQWLQVIDDCGSRLKINWPSGRLADVIAIQVWLARELDAHIREVHIFEELNKEKERIDQALEQIKESSASIELLLNQDPDASKIYDRLAEMKKKELFSGSPPHQHAKEVTVLGSSLRQGHNKCHDIHCKLCPNEELRRVECLFLLPEQSLKLNESVESIASVRVRAAQKFVRYCAMTEVDGNETGAWEWVKRAAEAAGQDRVNLACIIAVLFGWIEDVRTSGISEFRRELGLPLNWRFRWPLMLKSMAMLATPKENTPGSIELSQNNRDLIFVLRGASYCWFQSKVAEAKSYNRMRASQAEGDRLEHVAGAFGFVCLPIHDQDGVEHKVLDDGALRWTWKTVLLQGKGR